MNQWQESVIPYLKQQNYQEVIRIYEEIIENDPDNIDNYWYLGLACILQGEEEQAQVTWLVAFGQIAEEDLDAQTQILVEILSQEADRQFTLNNHQQAWIIRSQIRELVSEDSYLEEINGELVNHILKLIDLEIELKIFELDHLETYQLKDLINNSKDDLLDVNLLWYVLPKVVMIAQEKSLSIVSASLNHLCEPVSISTDKLDQIARHFSTRNPKLSISLTEFCLKIFPDDLYLSKNLVLYYAESKQLDKGREIAYELEDKIEDAGIKVYLNYVLLGCFEGGGFGREINVILERHRVLLKQAIALNKCPGMIKDGSLAVARVLLYKDDNPQEYRLIQNKIAKLFLEKTRLNYDHSIRKISDLDRNNKKIRIGYIAHTFRRHSVGYLCRWLFQYHDREKFIIFIYAINQVNDEITQNYFQKDLDNFYHLPDKTSQIVKQVLQDQIDILIDLDSLTHNITCQVMSLKPAPIQITWLGLDATGLSSVDYFIADPYVLPENAQEYYQEKIWRLPQTYLGVDSFEVGVKTLRLEDLEISKNAVIYFNIQNGIKNHPDMIHLQMKIIKAVPNSYLLVKGDGDLKIREELFTIIAEEEGVTKDRLRFLEQAPTEAIHRANLAIADVILDTYPYNGSTTTLEALWMEIPVVTRVGQQFAARNSYTYMTNAGITEGIAWSEDEYVEWGIKLGRDENLRKEISWKLRKSKKTSPLWNGKQFTTKMEKAYQQMWEIYCQNQT